MISAGCVYCDNLLFVAIDERYLDMLGQGLQMVSRVECKNCNKVNFVEHRRIDGEVFGEDDPRAKTLSKVT